MQLSTSSPTSVMSAAMIQIPLTSCLGVCRRVAGNKRHVQGAGEGLGHQSLPGTGWATEAVSSVPNNELSTHTTRTLLFSTIMSSSSVLGLMASSSSAWRRARASFSIRRASRLSSSSFFFREGDSRSGDDRAPFVRVAGASDSPRRPSLPSSDGRREEKYPSPRADRCERSRASSDAEDPPHFSSRDKASCVRVGSEPSSAPVTRVESRTGLLVSKSASKFG